MTEATSYPVNVYDTTLTPPKIGEVIREELAPGVFVDFVDLPMAPVTCTLTCTLGQPEEEEVTGITFLNLTGDITVSWDAKHADKMKELIRKKMKEGYVFFTTRKVPLTNIPYKRKLGDKGVDTAQDLIIKDEDFARIAKLMDDADIAASVDAGEAKLAKRVGNNDRKFQAEKRVRDPDEIKPGSRAVATRGLAGG